MSTPTSNSKDGAFSSRLKQPTKTSSVAKKVIAAQTIVKAAPAKASFSQGGKSGKGGWTQNVSEYLKGQTLNKTNTSAMKLDTSRNSEAPFDYVDVTTPTQRKTATGGDSMVKVSSKTSLAGRSMRDQPRFSQATLSSAKSSKNYQSNQSSKGMGWSPNKPSGRMSTINTGPTGRLSVASAAKPGNKRTSTYSK